MELRAFFEVFFVQKKLFVGIVLAFILLGLVVFVSQEQKFAATLTLNVARSGQVVTSDESEDYASFYRLQADERFADTVVRWLQSPRIVEDILHEVGVETTVYSQKDLAKTFQATRLSSQVIDVQYVTKTPDEAHKKATAMIEVLNAVTRDLNQKAQEESWFLIVGDAPVIRPHALGFGFVIALSFVAGFASAILITLFRYYYNEEDYIKAKN